MCIHLAGARSYVASMEDVAVDYEFILWIYDCVPAMASALFLSHSIEYAVLCFVFLSCNVIV